MSFASTQAATSLERRASAITVLALHGLAAIGLVWLTQAHRGPTAPSAEPIHFEMIQASQPEERTALQAKPIPLKPAPPEHTHRRTQQAASAPELIHTESPQAASDMIVAPATANQTPAISQAIPEPTAEPSTNAIAQKEETHAPKFDADYLHNPAPAYPRASRDLGEEGRVLLRVEVSAEGRALQVLIETGSGFARLDRAAREAVAQWRFVPARQGQKAVSAWVKVPIFFELKT